MSLEKSCINCGLSFQALNSRERICSQKCREERWKTIRDARRRKPDYCWKTLYNEGESAGLKMEAMRIQSGGVCMGCGEIELAVLSLDHINDNGCYERSMNNNTGGQRLYRPIVITNQKQEDLQVLCLNCQYRKRVYGPNPKDWVQRRSEYEEAGKDWVKRRNKRKNRPRLSEEEINEIKAILKTVEYYCGFSEELAKRFGTDSQTIRYIKCELKGIRTGRKYYYKVE